MNSRTGMDRSRGGVSDSIWGIWQKAGICMVCVGHAAMIRALLESVFFPSVMRYIFGFLRRFFDIITGIDQAAHTASVTSLRFLWTVLRLQDCTRFLLASSPARTTSS